MMRFLLPVLALFVALPAWAEVNIKEMTTPGGIHAWLVEEHSIPFVALELRFQGGTSLDPQGKEGVTNLMVGLLEEGAGDMDARAFARARFAYNEALSQSGWAAPQNMAAAQGYAFTGPIRTGGHRASAEAVAQGRADIAAIDAQTWRMILRYDAFAADLRVIAQTPSSPALPYITATLNDPAPILRALNAAIETLDAADRETLGLRAVLPLPAAAYLAVPNPPPPASETG